MKRYIILLALSIVLLAVLGLFYYSTIYKSAFEADQECHYEMYSISIDAKKELGCDHDLETRKWILFERQTDHKPAIVLKRFKY